jgi:selenocysteine-specific elongation factor
VIVATAGHIDHGKTLLVKALTGVDADRLPEEKRRGMTIDLGFAYLRGEAGTIGFVDVPGHERFIHNMLCGVAGIDCALLVVAADDGPMPQTLEHLSILDLLGIRSGVAALTKIDRVDAARVAAVRSEVERLLAATSLAGAPVVAVSGQTGEGVAELARELHRLAAAQPRRPADGNFRLAVDRAFHVAGAGLVVTGTVFSGRIAVGETVRALHAGDEARVRGLHAQSAPAERGSAGERCALNLAGLKPADVRRGEWIVAGRLPPPAAKLDARLRVLAGAAEPLRHWTPVHVHLGADQTTGRVALLEGDEIAPGSHALVQLVLARALGAVHGDRVVVRDQSARRTLAGGRVIDVDPPRRGRAKPERLALLRAMEPADAAQALEERLALAQRSGAAGVDLGQFAACRNLRPDELRSLCERLAVHRVSVRSAQIGFLASHWAALRERALRAVDEWHRCEPASTGLAEDRLLGDDARDIAVASAVADELVSEARLVRQGAHLRSPRHQTRLADGDEALWGRLARVLEAEEARPPTIAELAQRAGATPGETLAVLERAARSGLALRVSETRFFLPRTVSRLAGIAQALAAGSPGGRFTAAQFRDASGLGRNLAIDVLDYFDRNRYTRRVGDARMVLRTAAPAR